MKLYLAADYDINGQYFSAHFNIDSSNNLAMITPLTSILVPTTDGRSIPVAPKFLAMCKSNKNAVETALEWEKCHRRDGRLYDFKPIDPTAFGKTAA